MGVAVYFWFAELFVGAQGTPAPIFPTKSTVVRGLYRINRNPMYSSVLAVVFGQALFCQRWTVAEYGAFLSVCFHLFVVFYEERDLRARFDGEYEEFCREFHDGSRDRTASFAAGGDRPVESCLHVFDPGFGIATALPFIT
jgi:protein-S-isoprenylcysteine O-methyltransferase Ste14